MNIPNYTLIKKCGHGAYGEVWIAQDSVGRYVALKILQKSSSTEREIKGLKAFSRINSAPNLIQIFHVGEIDNFFYYTMELADDLGDKTYIPATLDNILKVKKRFSAQETIDIAKKILSGVATLHKANLVHRDIKPDNILYVNGVLKLSDVGLMRSVSNSFSLNGTLGFIPPERLKSPSSSKDNRDDLYAVGKVLYCLWSGKSADVYPSLPAGLDWDKSGQLLNSVIKTACNHRLSCRFKSVAEFNSALNHGVTTPKKMWQVIVDFRYVFLFPLLLLLVIPFLFKTKAEPKEVSKVEQKEEEKPFHSTINESSNVGFEILGAKGESQTVNVTTIHPNTYAAVPAVFNKIPREGTVLFDESFRSKKWQNTNLKNIILNPDNSMLLKNGANGELQLQENLPANYMISFEIKTNNLDGEIKFLTSLNQNNRVQGFYAWSLVCNNKQLSMTDLHYKDTENEHYISPRRQISNSNGYAEIQIIMSENGVYRIFIDKRLVLYSPAFFEGGKFSILVNCNNQSQCIIKNFKLSEIDTTNSTKVPSRKI